MSLRQIKGRGREKHRTGCAWVFEKVAIASSWSELRTPDPLEVRQIWAGAPRHQIRQVGPMSTAATPPRYLERSQALASSTAGSSCSRTSQLCNEAALRTQTS